MVRYSPDRGADAASTHNSFANQLHAYAERARCLLCPIYQSDHFTLLVLERWGDVDNEGDGKLPAQLARYGQRQTKHVEEEAKVFHQLSRPRLNWVSAWEVS